MTGSTSPARRVPHTPAKHSIIRRGRRVVMRSRLRSIEAAWRVRQELHVHLAEPSRGSSSWWTEILASVDSETVKRLAHLAEPFRGSLSWWTEILASMDSETVKRLFGSSTAHRISHLSQVTKAFRQRIHMSFYFVKWPDDPTHDAATFSAQCRAPSSPFCKTRTCVPASALA